MLCLREWFCPWVGGDVERSANSEYRKSTTTSVGRSYGDNESEECIIQSGEVMDDLTLGRNKGGNNIVRTVEYGYEEHERKL